MQTPSSQYWHNHNKVHSRVKVVHINAVNESGLFCLWYHSGNLATPAHSVAKRLINTTQNSTHVISGSLLIQLLLIN